METVAFVQQFASPVLDRFFYLVSALGSSRVYIILLLFAYLVLDPRRQLARPGLRFGRRHPPLYRPRLGRDAH